MTAASLPPSVTVAFEADGTVRVRHLQVFVPPESSMTHEAVVREAVKHLHWWLERHEQGKPEWSHGELR